MASIVRMIDSVNRVIAIILGVVSTLMFILVFAHVASRYVFNFSFPWTEELARYMMIWLVFLGAALVLRNQSMIAIEGLADALPGKARKTLKVAVYIICIIFFITVFVYGLEMMRVVEMQRTPSLQISMAIPYSAIPVSAVLLIMNAVAVILEIISNGQPEAQNDEGY